MPDSTFRQHPFQIVYAGSTPADPRRNDHVYQQTSADRSQLVAPSFAQMSHLSGEVTERLPAAES